MLRGPPKLNGLTSHLLPLPLLAALLALGTMIVLYLYRRDRAFISPRAGRLLVALRVALVALLLLALADLRYMRQQQETDPGTVLVVIDQSRSSGLKDPYRSVEQLSGEAKILDLATGTAELPVTVKNRLAGWTRQELVTALLQSNWWRKFTARVRVSGYSLSDSLRPLDLTLTTPLPLVEGGTDLGRPIAAEVMSRREENIVAVLLFSDGHHHAAEDPRESLRALNRLGVPLVAIGLGGSEKPRDIAAVDIDATGKVFANDEVRAQLIVESAGFPVATRTIEIREGDKRHAEFTAEISGGETTVRLPVSFNAGEPGRKRVTFTVRPDPEEVSVDNNSIDLWLEVVSAKANMVLLDGGPRWEWRYLSQTWDRDANITAETLLVTSSPHERLPDEYPQERNALFDHDVIVLGDVPASVFSQTQKRDLRDFVVGHGGTLVLIAGPQHMPYAWLDTPVAEILPVEPLLPVPATDYGATIARAGIHLELTEAGERSSTTRLLPGRQRNAELWELLPPHRWLSPIGGLVEGSEVLATVHAADASLLPGAELIPAEGPTARRARQALLRSRGAVIVHRSFGAGRVLYVGIDSTWHWRYRLGDELYQRFWGQVVRWAVSERLNARDAYTRLGTNNVLYAPDSQVTIEALVEKQSGRAIQQTVEAVITAADNGESTRTRLTLLPRSEGRYRGTIDVGELPAAPSPNSSRLRELDVRLAIPSLPEYATVDNPARVPIVIRPSPDVEARDTYRNAELLEELAALTGGTYAPLGHLHDTQEWLQPRPRTSETTQTTALWDFPWSLAAALLLLLATEWIVRKWRDLV